MLFANGIYSSLVTTATSSTTNTNLTIMMLEEFGSLEEWLKKNQFK